MSVLKHFLFQDKCDILVLDGSVAQLVEQRPEEPRVTGSSPVGTTIFLPIQKAPCGAFFGGWGCLEYL